MLKKAFTLAPDSAEAREMRFFLLWMPANRFPHEQAIAAYRRALVLNPAQFYSLCFLNSDGENLSADVMLR